VSERREELAANLRRVRERVADGCAAARRSADDVTVVVVTKTFPASDVALLAGLGVRDVGENRDQEASAKVDELRADADPALAHLRWHFVGQLQRNKAAHVARYADVVHSVDRASLVGALDKGAHRAERVLDVLVQVDLDEGRDAGRGGARGDDVLAVADAAAAASALRLRGVMAVAPRGEDPLAAFTRLAAVAERLRAVHPDAGWISAGMSGDLEAALTCGATHLRVGSAVLGSRPSLR
jgi:pyridoxal phosphate enzyme (YggS family)